MLAGELGTAWVQGLQAHGVGTSLKHFAVNNQETDRLRVSAEVDERTLREIYLAGLRAGRHAGRSRGRSCAPTTGSTGSTRPRTRGCSPTCCAASGASTASSCPTGVRSTTASRRCRPASTSRCPRPGASAPRRSSPRSCDGVARRVGARPRRHPSARTLVDGRCPASSPAARFDADEHHAIARAAATEGAVLLKNEGGAAAAARRVRAAARRDRRARRRPPLPGRRQLAGEPHPHRHGARRAARGSPRRRHRRLLAGLHAARAVRRRSDEATPTSPTWSRRRHERDRRRRRRGVPRPAGRRGVRGLRPGPPLTPRPTSSTCSRPSPRCTTEWWSCSRTVESSPPRSGTTTPPRCSSAGSGARPRERGRRPAAGRRQPVGQARRDDPAAPRGQPRRSATSPARTAWCAMARACSSGIATTTRSAATSRTRSASGCPTRPSPMATSCSPCRIRHRRAALPATWPSRWVPRSPTSGRSRALRSCRSMSASRTRQAPGPVHELRAFTKVVLEPGESRRVSFAITRRDLSRWSTRAHDWVFDPGRYEVAVAASSRDAATRRHGRRARRDPGRAARPGLDLGRVARASLGARRARRRAAQRAGRRPELAARRPGDASHDRSVPDGPAPVDDGGRVHRVRARRPPCSNGLARRG